jgi:hypothetical protein
MFIKVSKTGRIVVPPIYKGPAVVFCKNFSIPFSWIISLSNITNTYLTNSYKFRNQSHPSMTGLRYILRFGSPSIGFIKLMHSNHSYPAPARHINYSLTAGLYY